MADRWATDGHQWLNVPFDCGITIVRDPEAHRASMTFTATDTSRSSEARDAVDWTPEWSRRARGIPVYAALKEPGRDGVEQLVDRCCRLYANLVDGIGALEGAEIVARPTLNQGLLRFNRPGGSPESNDAFTDSLIALINSTGEAFFSGTTWQGRRAMRVSVVNWRTSDRDVERAVARGGRGVLAEAVAAAR